MDKYSSDTDIPKAHTINFAYVPGFFKHDPLPTGPDTEFRAEDLPGLGIIDRAYNTDDDSESNLTQWQRFERHIRQLNETSKNGEKYKVFFVGRHGEGVHNAKEREVGHHEWEHHWSRLDRDDEMTWLDARLTPKGIQQAEVLGSFWRDACHTTKIPIPETFYTSPLLRCLETARCTFSKDILPDEGVFQPVVKEAIREVFGVYTCDKRGTRSGIQLEFPEYIIEQSLTEDDELWTSQKRETLEERAATLKGFLEEVFRDDSATFLSVTTHSGTIRAFCIAIGHPVLLVATGSVIPFVVRGR